MAACIVHQEKDIAFPHLHGDIKILEPLLKDDTSHPCFGVIHICYINTRVKVATKHRGRLDF